jgi:hypothetical protein
VQCSKDVGANLRRSSFLDVSSLTLGRAGNRAAFFLGASCRGRSAGMLRFVPVSEGTILASDQTIPDAVDGQNDRRLTRIRLDLAS